MINMISKDWCQVAIHQCDYDSYQIEIVDCAGNKLTTNITEKQINHLAEVIVRYNDLEL